MGRPINKRKIGQGAGKIEVSRYFFTGASEVASTTTEAWIVNQRSSRKYTISDGTTTEVLTLVNQSSGDLSAGEFAIDAILDDSTIVQVSKLCNRTISVEAGTEDTDDSEATQKIKYNVGPGKQDDIAGTATLPEQN